MLLSLVYFAMRCPLQVPVQSGRGDLKREVELLVLRHQLKVLSRGVRQPLYRRRDRMLLAAVSRLLARHRWEAFVVTPRTLLRWHPGAGPAQVDVPAPRAGQTRTRSGDGGAHHPNGEGELGVGLPQDPRGAAEARRPGVGHRDPHGPSSARPRPRPSPERPVVERVPPDPSPRNLGG
jgi:hypothetical protein